MRRFHVKSYSPVFTFIVERMTEAASVASFPGQPLIASAEDSLNRGI